MTNCLLISHGRQSGLNQGREYNSTFLAKSTETGKLDHYCLSRESLDYRDVLSWSRVFPSINTIARMLEAHQLPWWLPARTGLVVVVLHHKVSSSVLLHADVSII